MNETLFKILETLQEISAKMDRPQIVYSVKADWELPRGVNGPAWIARLGPNVGAGESFQEAHKDLMAKLGREACQ
jgi:hypothetical protein